MITAVDSNILLDLLTGSLKEIERADSALRAAKRAGALCISMVCYAEVSRNFSSIADTDDFFVLLSCRVDELEQDTAFRAGRFFEQYRKRGGPRTRLLPDFLIAAHAQLKADRILTQDTRFFGTSFPRLKAVSPADLA